MMDTNINSNSKVEDAEPSTSDTTTTEMELNLRLDSNGRTTYGSSLSLSTTAANAESKSSNDNEEYVEPSRSKKAKTEEQSDDVAKEDTSPTLDYSSKTAMTNLSSFLSTPTKSPLNDLLFDCEIADSGLLPRTFWISAAPSDTNKPRCYLEQMALEIFHHHVPTTNNNYIYDPNTSGAEWWVQLRPSPPAGRYSMHANCDEADDNTKSGISFHWDKDEDLRIMCGGTMYIHPHLSTVTYLTDLGAPTMVITKRVDPMSGQYIQEDTNVEGFVSWPKQGKHLSFDGRYLHAAPSDLLEEGMFEQQCAYDTTTDEKILSRQHRRVTFLVNIWLNYKPFNVHPFPDTMIGNLSKVNLFGDVKLFVDDDKKEERKSILRTTNVIISNSKATIGNGSGKKEATELTKKTWPMGQGDDEKIEALMPVKAIRDQQENGSDIAISWKDRPCVVLSGASA